MARLLRSALPYLTVFLFLFSPEIARAKDADELQPFLGTFSGTANETLEGENIPRRIWVRIAPEKRGFSVEWRTTREKDDSGTKRSRLKVVFVPTNRKGIYGAAQQASMFGGVRPVDPLKGENFFWAYLKADTLRIYQILILADGGYMLQKYERKISGDTITFSFDRMHDGKRLKLITATLKRQ